MALVLHVIMFPKNLSSYNDILIMYAHIQSSQTMWQAMLTFKTETFQPIPSISPSPYSAAVKSLIDKPCQICNWLLLHQDIE